MCWDVCCLSRGVIFLGGILSHASGEETLRLCLKKISDIQKKKSLEVNVKEQITEFIFIDLFIFCFIHYSKFIYGNMKTVI